MSPLCDLFVVRISSELQSTIKIMRETIAGVHVSQSNTVSCEVLAGQKKTPGADSKIKLDKQHEKLIEKSELKNAISYGLVSSTAKSLRNMVNNIMTSIWTCEYMAQHSLTGRKCPSADKSAEQANVKERVNQDAYKPLQSICFIYIKTFIFNSL